MTTAPKRLHFIDYARSYAILLALLSHAMAATGTWQRIGENSNYIQQFTRMATPMFVFMFGFMMEYVYARKAHQIGLAAVRKRLFVRSFQCYFGYVLIAVCCLLSGDKYWHGFLDSLVLLSNVRWGNILKVYAVMLLIMPGIITLRLKYGIRFLYVTLVLLTIGLSFTAKLKSADFGSFNHLLNFLAGVGPLKTGPSVLHSFIFLLAGMYMASSLTSSGPPARTDLSAFYAASLRLLTTFVVLAVLLIQQDPVDAWRMFADYTYRGNNMIGYYIIGGITSVLALTAFCYVIGTKPPPRLAAFFLSIGTSSLISYTCGNILLVLFGFMAAMVSPYVFITLFFVCVILITKYIDRAPMYGFFNHLLTFKYP